MTYVDLAKNDLFKIVNLSENPVLPHGELGAFDEFGTYPVSVIRDENDIRVYYGGLTRCESVPFNANIGVAKSYDNGETFQRIGNGPVLSYSSFEPFIHGSPKIRKFNDTWYLWYCAGIKWVESDGSKQPIYKIRMATSDNGIDWKKIGKDLIESVLEENECQASADVIFAKGKYHMFFSYRYNFGFKTNRRGYRMGYAYSYDLINWIRDDERIGITTSEEGWDSESISYGHVFELNDILYMIYQGNNMGKTGIGIAQLENDLI
jgi:sucrose-6-phosphate hydrolase SacC (GH32 family)